MMRGFFRVAFSAASLLCVAGVGTLSTPSLAADVGGAAGSASAMLAAVTAPMIAGDIARLRASETFSTARTADRAADKTDPGSLEDLVASNAAADTETAEDRCLAASVYYESKGEPLAGQLAVAQTIINRAKSGRFADSVCGVVKQPGQFSFISHGTVPTPQANGAWSRAVAIAKIARDGLWKQIAPASLFFHARRVSPGWGKTRIASIGNHIFFR
jgi:spore germination cell wall hydrolase CwlJ-like protein